MSLFHYKAVNANGDTEEGEIDAAMESAAVTQLQDAGYIPIQVRAAGEKSSAGFTWPSLSLRRRPRVTPREVALFTREIATLLRAGLPLDHSLETMMDVSENPSLTRMVGAIYDKVRDGASFSDALEAQRGAFSELYINMVRAGESAGALDTTLTRVADYLKQVKEMRDRVTSALTYPLILVCVAGISIVVLLTFVVPQFSQMFADMGRSLPLPTRIVMGAGEVLQDYWWSFPLFVFATVFAVRWWLSDSERKRAWHRRVMGLPLVGDLVTKIEVARFTRTLGIMLNNGVPLLGALRIVRGSVRNLALADEVAQATSAVEGGQSLAAALSRSSTFPKLAVKMIRVGEESGQLEDMLLRLAEVYDQEAQSSITRMLSLLEPALIVGLGILIAGIIMSILVAVLGMNQLVI